MIRKEVIKVLSQLNLFYIFNLFLDKTYKFVSKIERFLIMTDLNKAEILAPVGNEEMLIAAVRSGANAVYLGAKDFSARRNAQNFTLEELKKAIEYCHLRNVKVYLTLNILIKDNEIENE